MKKFIVPLILSVLSTNAHTIVKGVRVKSTSPIAQATVALYNDQTQSFCTGTLIDDHWVLTAAHCVTKNWEKLSGDIRPKVLTIIFGEFNKSYYGKTAKAAFIQKHPDWGEALKVKTKERNDIALVRFDSKLPKNFAPLPLLSENDFKNIPQGADVTIAGFGMTSLRDHADDRKLYAFVTTFQGTDEDFKVARLVPHAGKPGGNCPGDSGGPAFIEQDGKTYVWGVASTAEVSCEKFGEYGNITAYEDWVKTTMTEHAL